MARAVRDPHPTAPSEADRWVIRPGQEVGVGPYKVLVLDQSAPTPVVNHDLGTRIEGDV